ncbi:ABC transporter permease [Sphaerisporangium rubeum]|uniref:NitT/TauT family transport system permease protein n=1 Tax=Sphaerisporangium rubeum TaxID=321317 RepID=A0A7X0IBX2_9ACTN|nr:ABC transporter permease [Sphaerisporangium rubeum]MBB6472372.1 NitT/TauT family transport system permease protein [Sphaerisporangium rubeum]
MIGRRVARGAIGVAGLLIAAEAAGASGLVDPALLPRMSAVLVEAVRLPADPEFPPDLLSTLRVWAIGLLVAVLGAVPLGLVLGNLRRAELASRPLVEFLRPIPSIALIPLVTLLVPSTEVVKIIAVVYASAWPLLINTMYGLKDVDPVAKDTLRSFGFGRLDVLRRVSLPSAAPFVMTGVRLASSVAFVVTVSTELLAGGVSGIGVYMLRAASGLRTDLILACILWTGALGLVANILLVRLQRRAFRWHAVAAVGES